MSVLDSRNFQQLQQIASDHGVKKHHETGEPVTKLRKEALKETLKAQVKFN